MSGLASYSIVVVICLAILECEGWTAIGKADVEDGKCKAIDGTLFGPGERWYDDERCVQATCGGEGEDLYESFVGCGTVSYPDECTLEPGVGHYPDCCPQPVCDFRKKKTNRVRRQDDSLPFGGRKRRFDSYAFGGRRRRQLDPVTLGAGAFGKWLKKFV